MFVLWYAIENLRGKNFLKVNLNVVEDNLCICFVSWHSAVKGRTVILRADYISVVKDIVEEPIGKIQIINKSADYTIFFDSSYFAVNSFLLLFNTYVTG